MACAAARDVVAVDRGDHNVFQVHLRGGVRKPQRLERGRWAVRPPAVPVARTARARAPVAPALGSGRAAGPTPAACWTPGPPARGGAGLPAEQLLDARG